MIRAMAVLDPHTAAARRQRLIDELTDLFGGVDNEWAPDRAAVVLALVESHGWRLPEAVTNPVPRRGPGSSPQARAAALADIRSTLNQRRHREHTR